MVSDRQPARSPALAMAAIVGAVTSLIAVAGTNLASEQASDPAAMVLAVTSLGLGAMALIRREAVRWWWSVSLAGAVGAAFVLLGDVDAVAAAPVTSAESSIELMWAAVTIVLVVVTFRSAEQLDAGRLRLSRLDGALATVAATTIMLLGFAPSLRAAEAIDERIGLVLAHAVLLAFAIAVVVRHLVVSTADRYLPLGLLAWTAAAFVRTWALATGHEVALDWSSLGLAAAIGAFSVAVALHQSADDSVKTELPDERVGLVALCGLGPALAAAGMALSGGDVDFPTLAAGTTVILLLVATRLHLVVRAVRDGAAREVMARQATTRLAAARDEADVASATVDAAAGIVGEDLRWAAYVRENGAVGYDVVAFVTEEAERNPIRAGVYAALDAGARGQLQQLIDTPSSTVVATTVVDRPWEILTVAVRDTPSRDSLDALAVLGTQAHNALDAVTRERELLSARSEARFEELVRHTNDAILIIGRNGAIQYQSPSVVRLLGYLPIDLAERDVHDLVPDEHQDVFDRFLHREVSGAAQRGDAVGITMNKADGNAIEVEVVGSNLLDNPDVGGIVLTVRDVSRHRELERQLRHQAFHDALTGLANRALFVERLDHALSVNRRSDAQTPAVAFIDLDDFKEVNDTLGHAAGDRLLKTISTRLQDSIREGDTAARFGGDEFAVLFEQPASVDSVIEACERIIEVLQTPVQIGDEVVRVGASIGLATRHDGLGESGEILRCADLAMYAAKEAGKGCVARFETAMHDAMMEELSSHRELAEAVDADQLDLVYQPVVELETGGVVGFEALVRWNHPTRGQINPADFVPLAEEIGVIGELGEWVVRSAVAQLVSWNATSRTPVRVHVNVSGRQLDRPGFVEVLRELVADEAVDPSLLVLEVTESVLVDEHRVPDTMAELHALGVRIAIDDFGTGYSSLSYLQRMTFDVLKIDRTFIESLGDVEPEQTLTRTIVDLAERLGVETVAEGVEREVERDGLRSLGCRYGQGYLYGRPVPAAEATKMLGGMRLRPVDSAITA